MKLKHWWNGAAALLLAWAGVAAAEDIDIYSAKAVTDVPNILFVLDNAANFEASAANCTYADGTAPSLNGTAGGIEQCALYNVVNGLPVNANGTGVVRIGLMAYNANNMRDINGANCGGGNGGCLMVPLMEMTSANKTSFLNWVKSWRTTGGAGSGYIKASGEATGAVMQEAWAYYAGNTGLSGRSYAGVQPPAGCQKNFVVFIGNAFNNSGTPGDGGSTSPKNALTSAPGVTSALLTPITIPSGSYGTSSFSCGSYSMPNHTDSSGLYADEWSRYMYQTDLYSGYTETQSIITYTIGLLGTSCKPDYPALLTSMAKYGGGKYYATSSYSEIAKAIQDIFNEVQAVNSVFSSASLPVSVNAQGTYLNQIFLGMFRPDASGSPRWVGNLKQYQFIMDPATGALQMGDSTGAPAISSGGTGFVSPNAISFWTSKNTGVVPDSTGGFFVNDQKGVGLAFDSPDGEVVEKGGAAQVMRNALLTVNYATTPSSPRRLYTHCTGCDADLTLSSNAFADGNAGITTATLGVADAAARTALINWVRGQDNKSPSDEKGPGGTVTVRPSVHGDVLHSRPVVVNYGGSTGVVVFYGSNTGVFHAVNGNQTAAIGTVPAGGELWGLVLPEHQGKLKRLRDNAPELKFPSTVSDTALPKDYFIDGASGVYQRLNADGTINKAYLYLTMRRGGRFMYALDVSSPTQPLVLWKISSSTTGFAELGQTWSRPRVTLLKGYVDGAGKPKPVLVFGAGYDNAAEDAEPPTAGTMGRGIFVVDAETGALIWRVTSSADVSACPAGASCISSAAMAWPVPADITFVDRDNDGLTERLYAADTGGNVWRVDLEPTAGSLPSNWQLTKLAALGCTSGTCAAGTNPRKFFYPPSVVHVGVAGGVGSYDAVLLGSGDREHPLSSSQANSVANRMYMLKDPGTGKDANSPSLAVTITESAALPEGLFDATSATYDGTRRGYYIPLSGGEKVVNASIVVRGTAFFGTNQPAPAGNSCSANLGVAKGYALNPFTSVRSSVTYDGGGMPPTPVAGIVVMNVNGQSVQQSFCVGCGGGEGASGGDTKSALGAMNPDKSVPKHLRRTYWYKR